jgi:hypothetical protein
MPHAAVLSQTNALFAVHPPADHLRSVLSKTNSLRFDPLPEIHVRPLSVQTGPMLFAQAAVRTLWLLGEVSGEWSNTSPSGRGASETSGGGGNYSASKSVLKRYEFSLTRPLAADSPEWRDFLGLPHLAALYVSRSAWTMGRRTARMAGKSPPTSPIESDITTP